MQRVTVFAGLIAAVAVALGLVLFLPRSRDAVDVTILLLSGHGACAVANRDGTVRRMACEDVPGYCRDDAKLKAGSTFGVVLGYDASASEVDHVVARVAALGYRRIGVITRVRGDVPAGSREAGAPPPG